MTTPEKSLFLDLQRQVDQLFEDLIYRPWAIPSQSGWRPALDLHEMADAFLIEVDLPGVKPEDMRLVVGERGLIISGQRQIQPPTGAIANHCERSQGGFQRTLDLPRPIVPDRVEAEFSGGICFIRLPKKNPSEFPARGSAGEVKESGCVIQIMVR